MNAISTKFAVFDNETRLGTAPPAALESARTGTTPSQGESRHAGGLSEVAELLRAGEGGERASLAEALRERYPSSPVVVLFLSDHSDEALRAIGLRELERWPHRMIGTSPQPVSSAPSAEVTPITRDRTRPVGDFAVAARPPTARSLGLTQRQMDVLALMVQGKPNKLICRELRLAEGTVKCHVSAILRALQVGTRTQAALKAARLGLGADDAQVR